jgi:hypothetical protein
LPMLSRACCYTVIIPANQEAEVGRWRSESGPSKNSRPYLKSN